MYAVVVDCAVVCSHEARKVLFLCLLGQLVIIQNKMVQSLHMVLSLANVTQNGKSPRLNCRLLFKFETLWLNAHQTGSGH